MLCLPKNPAFLTVLTIYCAINDIEASATRSAGIGIAKVNWQE